jgi:AraC-like DNA-binding protein
MDTSTSVDSSYSKLRGVVPATCDAEAGQEQVVRQSSGNVPITRQSVPVGKLRSVIDALRCAIHSALKDERVTAEDGLRRASELLDSIDNPSRASSPIAGGLAAWQIRKVTHFVDANLATTIRNEDLAALTRLTPSHFGRAFRNSVGECPHEFVMRRRIERAQELMLSTDANLSDIALDCGLADQSHLTRLFKRLVGESPRTWRRAHIGE